MGGALATATDASTIARSDLLLWIYRRDINHSGSAAPVLAAGAVLLHTATVYRSEAPVVMAERYFLEPPHGNANGDAMYFLNCLDSPQTV